MTSISISLIISNRNRAPLLDRALASIVRQRSAVHEVIVGDDGSTDSSLAVCAKYAAQLPLQVFETESTTYRPCIGTAKVLNEAFRRSTGDIVIQQNAEVVHVSDCVQALAEAVSDDRTAAFATVFDGQAEWLDVVSPDGRGYQHVTPRLYSGRLRPVPWFFLGATTRAGYLLYREDLEKHADAELGDRMLAAGYRFRFVDHAVAYHCSHGRT